MNTLRRTENLNPEHVSLLEATLRAPSAHNTQPWQIKPLDDQHTYEIHARQGGNLPKDTHNKDTYLTMGAFIETLSLEAPNHGVGAEIEPVLAPSEHGLFIASVRLDSLKEDTPIDPLSQWISHRVTNRNSYDNDPLPCTLTDDLEALGNTFVDPKRLGKIVLEAGIDSWADPQYVHDLKEWFRKDPDAPDGITPPPFHLSKTDVMALDFAFWRGKVPRRLGGLYSSQDVKLVTSSPAAAVISAPEMTPPHLFDAGRRLLRSWTTITGAGFSSQPVSIVVDEEPTAAKLAQMANVDNPVALYRVGKTTKPPRAHSNRRPLEDVLI